MNIKKVNIRVRRVDMDDSEKILTLNLDPDLTYADLKQTLLEVLEISNTEDKVFKIRNGDGILVPLIEILEHNFSDEIYLVEVTNVHHDVPTVQCSSPLHSMYVDAVKNKIQNMESRVSRVEAFVPQLNWRRKSLLERTTHTLESRIAFLDRRIDELTPAQWHEYMQNMAA